MIHPDNDQGPDRGDMIWWHGKLVERDLPEYLEEKRQRAARRCQIDWPWDEEKYDSEED